MKNEPTPTTLSAELQRELNKAAEDYAESTGTFNYDEAVEDFKAGALSPIAQRIHREGWVPVQWISVKDELPKPNECVWVYCQGQRNPYVFIGGRIVEDKEWCWAKSDGNFSINNDGKLDSDCDTDDYEPHYWLPLPSPPNAPVGKGYISVEEADKMVLEAVRELTIKKCDEAIELINKNYTPPNVISIEEHERLMKEFSEFTGRYLVNPNLRYRNTDELLAQFKSTKEEGGE